MNRAPLGKPTCTWAADGEYECERRASPYMMPSDYTMREGFASTPDQPKSTLYTGEPQRRPPLQMYSHVPDAPEKRLKAPPPTPPK